MAFAVLFSDFPEGPLIGILVAVGLCFGSFLNVVIYRVPRGMSVIYPPSACPHCGARIRALDNLPVLGWLILRGKARCCGAPIAVRYPLVEALGGLLAGAIFATRLSVLPPETSFGIGLLYFGFCLALGLGLIALTFIDLEFMILPDVFTYGGAVLGVIWSFTFGAPPLIESVAGLALGFLVVWFPFIWLHEKLRGFPGMGLGDAKLLMVAGAFFGWFGVFFALFAAAVQGTATTLLLRAFSISMGEPEAVQRELEELKEAIETAEGEEKLELMRELEQDPLGREAEPGFGGARIAFGPFLALATLELLLFEPVLRDFFLSP